MSVNKNCQESLNWATKNIENSKIFEGYLKIQRIIKLLILRESITSCFATINKLYLNKKISSRAYFFFTAQVLYNKLKLLPFTIKEYLKECP